MTIAVDFDGTIVEHAYPRIGKERMFAMDTLRALSQQGHKIILWTARDGEYLRDAVEWCRKRGLEFYSINSNQPVGALFGDSRDNPAKVIADVYIDDRNIGGIPDWSTIYAIITGKTEDKRSRHHRNKGLFRRLFK